MHLQVALLFLRLGTTAFGGPAVHIAMMEDEVVRRRGEVAGSAVSWLVAVNHGDVDAELPAAGVELLSGARASGSVVVPAGGVVVLREEEV